MRSRKGFLLRQCSYQQVWTIKILYNKNSFTGSILSVADWLSNTSELHSKVSFWVKVDNMDILMFFSQNCHASKKVQEQEIWVSWQKFKMHKNSSGPCLDDILISKLKFAKIKTKIEKSDWRDVSEKKLSLLLVLP